ncbi:L,D-transpeptidase family protein [Streptomyces coffeae]|uniref:L,D-transpeptidase family protein n=1 Tax=Streptomyces coffeae TaxID=621382 RepID=UPI0035588960
MSVPRAGGETSHTTTAGDRAPGEQRDVLPGLGSRTRAEVPDDTRQALVVTGSGRNSSTSKAVLYERTATGWQAKASWPARNALRGWTAGHRAGDLRSPIGVFTLSDAGGRLADPGSALPYSQSPNFRIGGTGFAGEPLVGSFDYVIAIDYNRERGTSPLDATKPLGAAKGGGIWIHVDHGGPTHGCIGLARPHVERLLRVLDPARHPVVVMGDAASLAT